MLSYGEALSLVQTAGARRRRPVSPVQLSLEDAVGGILAADLPARENNPRFDNSAMDGFALLASDTRAASGSEPCTLSVIEIIGAGDIPSVSCPPRSCFEITTGAVLPSGCDAVVRLEDIEELGGAPERVIRLRRPVNSGENVRYTGQDIRVGEQLFAAGQKVEPQHLLALAMSGYQQLPLQPRLKVVLLATGNELVSHEVQDLSPSQIRNSTQPLAKAVLAGYGVETESLGIVPDNEDAIYSAFLRAQELRPDLIISTGGVSVGRYDLVAKVLNRLSAEIHFHKVAIRPGKPILFAEFPANGSAFFGLPGNPIAVAVGLRFFVQPYLRARRAEEPENEQRLPLRSAVSGPNGLTYFQRGVRKEDGVVALSGQASFMAASFRSAEGWLVTGPESTVPEGTAVPWCSLW